ncbi:MAG: CYTH domain-containing protein [Bacteroidales bacterium]|nr:CYTH domain-containing protein [Bacteroidales bacterium]
MEIERKYLVRQLPDDLEQYEHFEIEQAYLCTSPTLRIRKMGDAYILTVKEKLSSVSSAIHNREEEFALSEQAFQHLLTKCDNGRVGKTRYRINLRQQMGDGAYEGLTAELDIFHGRHRGLMLVEVEFPNTQVANSFVPPDWFGEDVSSDYHYRNSYLASMP